MSGGGGAGGGWESDQGKASPWGDSWRNPPGRFIWLFLRGAASAPVLQGWPSPSNKVAEPPTAAWSACGQSTTPAARRQYGRNNLGESRPPGIPPASGDSPGCI